MPAETIDSPRADHEGPLPLADGAFRGYVPRVARALASILLALLLFTARHAGADLGHDVEALSVMWRSEGDLIHLGPQLYERGELRYLALPPKTLRTRRGGCTTVAILGVPAASFVVRFEAGDRKEQPHPPVRSRAGIAEITRCERERRALRGLVIELRSPRAALETLVLVSPGPPGEAYRALPERLPGPSAGSVDPGRAPPPGDIVGRAKELVARFTQRGAEEVDHGLLQSDVDGSGLSVVNLESGCHEVIVMGVPAPQTAPRSVDLDVDVVWPSGEIAASDHTDAPDAAIHICVAQTRRLGLRYAGALPRSPVLFVHARWPLPPGLDSRWPPEVRAGLAQALRSEHLRIPNESVVAQSLGIAGLTGVPLELEPDACYVLGVTAYRGQTQGIAAAVAVGSGRAQNHGGPEGKGTALAFCARGEDTAVVEVEAIGTGGLVAWHLAIWQSGRLWPGEVAE